MLDSINRKKSGVKVSEVQIKVKPGLETKKAYNHQVGDTLPKRRFFGLLESEAKQIAESIKSNQNETPPRMTLAELRRNLALIGLEQED